MPRRRFDKLTRQRLKRGVFTSIAEMQTAINRFIAASGIHALCGR
jgi:hypothetical protein